MAVTKIWPIKGQLHHSINYIENQDKTSSALVSFEDQSLLAVMHYAADNAKTEKRFYVSGINCNPDYANDQFITVKKQFDKEGGIVAYHAYQSFAPGEVTPAQAHAIGLELAKELWGDNFQVVVATHLNTDCYHNHLVVNSISFKDGHRCRQAKWYELQAFSDRICLAHDLSTVENKIRKSRSQHETSLSEAGMPTRYNLAKTAIDEAISKSCNLQEFNSHLKALGYSTQFNPKRKYWTVTLPGWEKSIRLARLGDEYTNERILERITENSPLVRIKAFQERKTKSQLSHYHVKKPRPLIYGSLYKLYLHYCYRLGIISKRRQNPNRLYYLLRDDLIKVGQLSAEFRYLGQNKIGTIGELGIRKNKSQQSLEVLIINRDNLRKKLRRKVPDNQKERIKAQISATSNQIKSLRREVKLCERIEERSIKMRENLQTINKEERRKEYYKS
ncbi:relaxase/mobilization nuclease domain-containing protein [Ohessyouella blattaphilus]|uniref:Relaxase/mobilization nuclease domain-containing protein n=1 Tax=Ohessyouella blattaphilus TaxID=2949333 RepID=A0ABT1EJM9_9FIRM|nr:relaxase/mobilization nuclease domain-containing protein [Ohessyouella blattaphilus]MCP1110906.1 relaxase/mobilization nuclease domain-containing protein [Ohessyouella blattaphilus]MCR8564300.1 relaxase/mobilization nuclease domain-containing protein [Ohessyouella blattaphilus]